MQYNIKTILKEETNQLESFVYQYFRTFRKTQTYETLLTQFDVDTAENTSTRLLADGCTDLLAVDSMLRPRQRTVSSCAPPPPPLALQNSARLGDSLERELGPTSFVDLNFES